MAGSDDQRPDVPGRKRQPQREWDRIPRRQGGNVYLQGRAQVHRQVLAERSLHLQQDRRARHDDHADRQAVHGGPGPVVRAAAPTAARAGVQ